MLALCFDELKNAGFEQYRKAFSKTVPSVLAKMNLGQLLVNDVIQKQIVVILRVYLESRMRSDKDLEIIFPDELEREHFVSLSEHRR